MPQTRWSYMSDKELTGMRLLLPKTPTGEIDAEPAMVLELFNRLDKKIEEYNPRGMGDVLGDGE